MTGHGKLTELLTKEPLDMMSLFKYCRARKLDLDDLAKFALYYQELSRNKRFNSKLTPLHVASAGSKPDIIRILVNEGWSVETDLEEVASPLHIALENGNISGARCLIELGADPNVVNRSNRTPIDSAISKNKRTKSCLTTVKFLIEEAKVTVNAIVDYGSQTKAIHVAVINDLPNVVSYLLQMGADINAVDTNNITPLQYAVYHSKIEIIKLLMLHNADMYIENKDGDTPLLTAVEESNKVAIDALVAGGYDVNRLLRKKSTTALCFATSILSLPMVKVLIHHGANPNKLVRNGRNVLHVLAATGNKLNCLKENEDVFEKQKAIAEFLVDNGALLKSSSEDISALAIAIFKGCYNLAKLYIRLGANVNSRPVFENGSLFHQTVSLNRDIILYFLDYGADYNTYNSNNYSPYHIALSQMVDLRFIKSFVKHGCPYDQNPRTLNRILKRVEFGTEKFFTAQKKFFQGIKENNLQLVKSAVKDGAVATSCCEEIKYPLHLVSSKGYTDLVTYLLEEGFPANCLNDKGESPLYVSAKGGHYNVCQALLMFGASYNHSNKISHKNPFKIAMELNHKKVFSLINKIDCLFKLVQSKRKHIIRRLEKSIKNEFLMFMNVTNSRGDTLMASALRFGCVDNAKEIMSMRLKHEES